VNLGFITVEEAVSQQTSSSTAAVPVRVPRPLGLGPRAIAATTSNGGAAVFQRYKGSDLKRYFAFEAVSQGGCIVVVEAASQSGITDPAQSTGLRAGAITSKDQAGTVASWPALANAAGLYAPNFPSGYINSAGDAITVSSTVGADVGAFDPTVNFTSPLFSWNELTSLTTVTRSQGVTVTWKDAVPTTDVLIIGGSSNTQVVGLFICVAPAEAGAYTVGSYITDQMPPGQGSLTLVNTTVPVPFTATGLDRAWMAGEVTNSAFPVYN